MSLVLEHGNFEEHVKILGGQGVVVIADKPTYAKDRGTGEPVKVFRTFLTGNIGERSWFVCFIDGSSSYYPPEDVSNFHTSYDISYVDSTYLGKVFRVKQVEHKAGLPELPEGLRWKVVTFGKENSVGEVSTKMRLSIVSNNDITVTESRSYDLPSDEKVFYNTLRILAGCMVIPKYNPFDLNW